MFRKFLEGLCFGGGFALAFILIAGVASSLLIPMIVRPPAIPPELAPAVPSHMARMWEEDAGPPFHELPVEQQIATASVIALARYEPAPDGRLKAVIKEILKKTPGTEFYYAVGDEYTSGSYYPVEGRNRGDGMVIFFKGSPAMMRMSMTYTGDRIHSLGDIPLQLFREKCDESKSSPGAAAKS